MDFDLFFYCVTVKMIYNNRHKQEIKQFFSLISEGNQKNIEGLLAEVPFGHKLCIGPFGILFHSRLPLSAR